MDKQLMNELVDHLLAAEARGQAIDKITQSHAADLTEAEAYQVQAALIQSKLQAGDKLYAPKLGLTSKPKMEQMGVNNPIYGYLLGSMIVEPAASLSIDDCIHPKLEPEIGIILKEPMQGLNVTRQDVIDNIEYIVPCIEIIDSRYKNYGFDLADVISDNASSKYAVIGQQYFHPDLIDLVAETVEVSINGELVATGKGANVLEHPLDAIVYLVNALGKLNQQVDCGRVIMTGGMTPAISIQAGDYVEVNYSCLGQLTVAIV